jgi:uncharacterized protein YjbI with pentapeptide repeats
VTTATAAIGGTGAMGDERRDDVLGRLRDTAARRGADLSLAGADLRGADLAGARLAFVDRTQARLDGADLTGARLEHVVLAGARLDGARLAGAEVSLTDATGATFAGCDAAGSTWRQATLLGAGFRGARLSGATLHACRLESAVLADAALDGASLFGCCCDEADLSGADADGLEALDSTFRSARLDGTRRFARCRELVAEVLRRDVDPDDAEVAALVGAVLELKRWCWADWKAYLATPDHAGHAAIAAEIFAAYPESGLLAAFEAGASWR